MGIKEWKDSERLESNYLSDSESALMKEEWRNEEYDDEDGSITMVLFSTCVAVCGSFIFGTCVSISPKYV